MTNLTALLERVREAEGADRELDAAVYCHADMISEIHGALEYAREDPIRFWDAVYPEWRIATHVPPRYTASLDAAVALVVRVRSDVEIHSGRRIDGSGYASLHREGGSISGCRGKTPTLALIAALLASLVEGE